MTKRNSGASRNVILLIFDTLRKDCISAYGSPPWGNVKTPNFDSLASESIIFDRAFPESLPTLPARRAIYTGQRTYPFHNGDFSLKGDFRGAPGWGPIPEEQHTIAEMLQEAGYRTGLIADVYHMFKPSKNFWRGFDQWTFLRGQEGDPQRSGPEISDEELAKWVPSLLINDLRLSFVRQCLKNMYGRIREEDYFVPQVMLEAVRWLDDNNDADNFFLCIESFDPHEPWFVPDHYRQLYDGSEGPEQVVSTYDDVSDWPPQLLSRTKANYSGLVTMCDRWFRYLFESLRTRGLLDNTLLILTTDHGHSFGEEGYLGKRGYPSEPSVYDIPLMVRPPGGNGNGQKLDAIVQHTDIPPTILDFAGVDPKTPMEGRSLLDIQQSGDNNHREHATIAWGSAFTVVNDHWWLNAKVDGTGAFLYDLNLKSPREKNLANERPEIVEKLFAKAVKDAGGEFPEYLIELARTQTDAPGCSALAPRPL